MHNEITDDLKEPLLGSFLTIDIDSPLPAPEPKAFEIDAYIPPLFASSFLDINDLKSLLKTSRTYFFSIVYFIYHYEHRIENLLSRQVLSDFFRKYFDDYRSIDLTAKTLDLIHQTKTEQHGIDKILLDHLSNPKFSAESSYILKRDLYIHFGGWGCGMLSTLGLAVSGITSAFIGVTPTLHKLFIALGASSGAGFLIALGSFIRICFFSDKVITNIKNNIESAIETDIKVDNSALAFKQMIHHTLWVESKGQLPPTLHKVFGEVNRLRPSIKENFLIFLKDNKPKNWKIHHNDTDTTLLSENTI
ncbi:MAG: hypothetical protein JSR33_00685 [Proteobacteria bacterium]|nr:hypothetical protein [Pseudomonadota bacterium]